MHMDAIAILNDAVGGVTVEVTEDFSQVDAGIPMGTVKLLGDQAITFVRSRQGVGDQKNTSRIARHEAYVSGFAQAFREAQAQNTEFIFEAYEDVLPYIVTNCSSKAASALISRFEGYSIDRVLTLEGENTVGKQYWEFYPDQEKLDALILELFYSPK
jgi:anionic cell wall polymer biosynthesis LytR-Cps2A-Psr (LCP) family protein